MLPIEIIIEVLTFGIVVAVSLAIERGILDVIDVRRRLGDDGTPAVGGPSVVKRGDVSHPFLMWVQRSSSLNNAADRQKLRRDLALAGFDHPSAPVWYVIGRFGGAIGLPLLFITGQTLASKPMHGPGLVFVALVLCGLSLLAPRAFIDNRANSRRAQIEHEFPDALDLLVICVEAGLGLEAAFVRVGEEVVRSHPRVSAEFGQVSAEFRAGRSRADALRAMADRCDVESVRSFSALIIQTEALGASVGQTLRTYSVEMRSARFLKAEEKAMRIPVLMTIPLVSCILPVIITSLLLPPIIDVIRQLLPALRGMHHG
jgi:tight adherence protein C